MGAGSETGLQRGGGRGNDWENVRNAGLGSGVLGPVRWAVRC